MTGNAGFVHLHVDADRLTVAAGGPAGLVEASMPMEVTAGEVLEPFALSRHQAEMVCRMFPGAEAFAGLAVEVEDRQVTISETGELFDAQALVFDRFDPDPLVGHIAGLLRGRLEAPEWSGAWNLIDKPALAGLAKLVGLWGPGQIQQHGVRDDGRGGSLTYLTAMFGNDCLAASGALSLTGDDGRAEVELWAKRWTDWALRLTSVTAADAQIRQTMENAATIRAIRGALDVVEPIAGRRAVTVTDVKGLLHCPRLVANKIVKRLVDARILDKFDLVSQEYQVLITPVQIDAAIASLNARASIIDVSESGGES